MGTLVVGILIWSLLHFIPTAASGFRSSMVQRLTLPVYKGIFGLIIIGAALLVIHGYKAASVEPVYQPPPWGAAMTVVLTFFAFILLFAPYMENSFSRILRHPQLVGVVLWGVGHLLSSGEARAVVLFAGFTLWAVIEILLINRHEGPWAKPAPASFMANFRLVLTGAGFFAIILYTHNWLFGVGALPNP